MEGVLFNYVVQGVVIEGPMSYKTVLERTGLKDTVGFTELGYIEDLPNPEPVQLTIEQFNAAVRGSRNFLLQQSDWTQLVDAPVNDEEKELWASYRQELRDILTLYTEVIPFDEIAWPVAPTK